MEVLKGEGLSFYYDDKENYLFKDIDISLKKGEITGIMGESGCGKTTLLYCLCGIIPKLYDGNIEGKITILGDDLGGESLSDISQKIGVVFQNPDNQLFSSCVEDEIAFGPENFCVEGTEIAKRIDEMLGITKMEKYRNSNPYLLSGGEKQLIALSSVLALKPEVLFFDETMSALDGDGVKLVKEAIIELKKQGKTILIIDHNIKNLNIADKIYKFDEGKISLIEKI